MLFKIELATRNDIENVFNLSNDILVRKNSFNSYDIKWKDHQRWFKKKTSNEESIFFVVKKVDDNEFIGQVRFDIESKNEGSYVIAISLVKKVRGKGLGTKILREVSKKVIDNFNVKKIVAYIKNKNKASLKCFINCDYKIFEETIIDGCSSIKLLYK